MRNFEWPACLDTHAHVSVIASAGYVSSERFEPGSELLRKAGYTLHYDTDIYRRFGYLAGEDTRRATETLHAFATSSSSMVWAARGGFGTTRLLPLLENLSFTHKKWFVGFSDLTALHVLHWNAGLVSLHGPNVTTLATLSEEARNEVFAWLHEPLLQRVFSATHAHVPLHGLRTVTAPIFAGNLTVLAALCGTPYQPSFEGAIVLLEDIHEQPYRLDRHVTQMLQAGLFKGVQGIVLGQFTDCHDANMPSTDRFFDAMSVVSRCLLPLEVPMLMGIDIGHDPSSRSLPNGAIATLDVSQKRLSVQK